MKVPKVTTILGYDGDIPIIEVYPIDSQRVKFWCDKCKRYHTHGLPEGHRSAHCGPNPGFRETGYMIRLKKA